MEVVKYKILFNYSVFIEQSSLKENQHITNLHTMFAVYRVSLLFLDIIPYKVTNKHTLMKSLSQATASFSHTVCCCPLCNMSMSVCVSVWVGGRIYVNAFCLIIFPFNLYSYSNYHELRHIIMYVCCYTNTVLCVCQSKLHLLIILSAT